MRGDVTRVIFYMLDTYGLNVSAEGLAVYQGWDVEDPVDAVERDLAERTATVRGNKNRHVMP